MFHERIKHIDAILHFIHDIVSQDVIKLEKVLSKFNPSDMRTKVLSSTNVLFACVQALLGIKVEIC